MFSMVGRPKGWSSSYLRHVTCMRPPLPVLLAGGGISPVLPGVAETDVCEWFPWTKLGPSGKKSIILESSEILPKIRLFLKRQTDYNK